jgi:thymidylate synthase (FAD)
MPTVDLISITPNYMDVLKTACSQPYGKDVTEKSIKKIIESGHLSVLEHCCASFLVTCSVRVLGQLTRHRHLSFTCKSARGSRFDTLVNPYTLGKIPLSYFNVGRTYIDALKDEDTKEEQAAYFLPQGVETSLVVTGNFRAWYEYLPKRLCKRAMPEHRKLAGLIQERLADAAPEIFDKNFMNCKKCTERSCDFK